MDKFNKLYNKIISESRQEYDWDIEEEDGFDYNEETGEFERSVSKFAPDAEEELGHYYGRLYGTVKGNTIEWNCQCHSDAADQDMEPEIDGKTHGIKKVKKGQTVNMVLSNLWAEFMEAFEELDVRDMWGDQDQDYDDDQEYDEQEDWG